MRIAQFGESFIPVYDGVGRVMKAYADTMTARGHEVYVITPQYNTGYRGGYPFEIVDFTSIPLSKKKSPYRIGIEKLDPHFVERINQIPLDICHSHGPAFAGRIGLQIAKKRNIPIIGTFHTKFYDDILEVTHSKAVAKIGAKTVADFYQSCDEVWAVSPASAETLRSYGFKGDIVVMPNGSNKRKLNSELVPKVVEQYKIRRDIPVFLFVGQIDFKKNLKRIVSSCKCLKEDGFDFQLVFAGRGPDEENLKTLLDSAGLEDRTVMTGHLQDIEILDCIYSLADLFLFPSVYDNAPMVLREAAAMKTPSLVVENSCSAEGILSFNNGIVAKDSDVDISSSIKKFFNLSKEEQESIAVNAYNTIPVEWNGELMDNILGRYENLIDLYKFKNGKN